MPWINHLPPVCWSTFGILVWNDSGYVNLTQWWYFFIIFEYILHISTPHIMIFCFPLPYFPLSQQVLYFLLSTLVLTLYIDVVLSLSTMTLYFHSWQYLVRGWLYHDINFSLLKIFGEGVIISWHLECGTGGDNIWMFSLSKFDSAVIPGFYYSYPYIHPMKLAG